MHGACLNEVRLLASERFDSEALLSTIMAGDMRLPERFRAPQLVALGSRMRTRLFIEPYPKNVLLDYLQHALNQAGAEHLMTSGLKDALAEHAAGNLRMLNFMAAELLAAAADKNLPHLDEKLFFEAFSRHPASKCERRRKDEL